VKRQLILGLAGVVGLGVAGAAAVALLTRPPDRAPPGPGPAPGSTPASAAEAGALPERPALPLPLPPPAGPRYLALPPDAIGRDLAAALRPCHGRFRMGPGPPAVLTLELESEEGGGFVVVDTQVASAGGAGEGLISCLRDALPGQRVAGGPFQAGERFMVEYTAKQEVVATPQARPPPPTTPTPTSTSVSRQQLSRRGGSR